jgi:hypothetical protein
MIRGRQERKWNKLRVRNDSPNSNEFLLKILGTNLVEDYLKYNFDCLKIRV